MIQRKNVDDEIQSTELVSIFDLQFDFSCDTLCSTYHLIVLSFIASFFISALSGYVVFEVDRFYRTKENPSTLKYVDFVH